MVVGLIFCQLQLSFFSDIDTFHQLYMSLVIFKSFNNAAASVFITDEIYCWWGGGGGDSVSMLLIRGRSPSTLLLLGRTMDS